LSINLSQSLYKIAKLVLNHNKIGVTAKHVDGDCLAVRFRKPTELIAARIVNISSPTNIPVPRPVKNRLIFLLLKFLCSSYS
jgi:hypothetical protein